MAKKKRRFDELNALKGRIREMGTTYRRLADDLGIGANTLSNKINGFQAFTVSEMEQICEVLDIAPGDVARFFMPSYCKVDSKSA